jgi:hypothetical protein
VSKERMHILRMIEEQQISPDEGIQLLEALFTGEEAALEQIDPGDEGELAPSPPVVETPAAESKLSGETVAAPAATPDFSGFHNLWLIPMAAGGFLSAVGLGFIVLMQMASPGSFFLLCGGIPLLLGLMTVMLAFWSRTARWLHIRVRGEQQISLSFPLPLRLTGWVLRLARPYVPQLEKTGLDEVILALDESLVGEEGFYVDVQDGEDGEHVQVYIG